jgi:hypothetical protein
METRLSLSTSIFESFGAISEFSFVEGIREKYEAFAVSKIQDSSLKLTGAQHFLKEMTPGQARRELDLIEPVTPVLKDLRYSVDSINRKEFPLLVKAAGDFFEAVDFIIIGLNDLAEIHSSYKASLPVLAHDLESQEDEHWNNY